MARDAETPENCPWIVTLQDREHNSASLRVAIRSALSRGHTVILSGYPIESIPFTTEALEEELAVLPERVLAVHGSSSLVL